MVEREREMERRRMQKVRHGGKIGEGTEAVIDGEPEERVE